MGKTKRIILIGLLMLLVFVMGEQKLYAVVMHFENTIVDPYSDAPMVYVEMNPSDGEFIYDGEKHYLELILKHKDGTPVDSSNYKITYDSDCKSIGMQYVTLTFLGNYTLKNYSGTYTYWIMPGKTEKVDVQATDKEVKFSWKAVPGATHYRLGIYDEQLKDYREIEWEDGSIEAPYLTRTLTDLEPGKTYKMSVKAVWYSDDGERALPSNIQTEFTVKVPREGEIITTTPEIQSLTGPDTIVTKPDDETTTVDDETTTIMEEVVTVDEATTYEEKTTINEKNSKETDDTTKSSTGDAEKNNLIWYVLGIGAAVTVAVVTVAGGVIIVTVKKSKIS